MPPLYRGSTAEGPKAESPRDKTNVLRAQFFPVEPDADLSDISGFEYRPEVEPLPTVTGNDVLTALRGRPGHSAPGIDTIPNGFLKALGEPFIQAITKVTNACWATGHYPARYKAARTVALRKQGKPDYSSPKAWRPIALLNTTGKLIEAVTAAQIRRLAEQHGLLPAQQMGARRNRSTITALDLLVNQIHTIWGEKDRVASLLALDISGAFDRVVRDRLLHVLRAKGMPRPLVDWVGTFMSNRRTTIIIPGWESEEFAVPVGIPQGSPLSPILFLFYIAELLESCNSSRERVSAAGFVDDTTLLAYGPTTEGNCRALERVHDRCLAWAKRYGATFAPEKYELIHLTRRPGKFNMGASIEIQGAEKRPSTSIRVLGIQVDSKLQWGEHVRAVKSKMWTQINALMRLSASTWGATFTKARQIYSAVIRPAMTYGAAIWHTPSPSGRRKPLGVAAKLVTTQNACLRRVAGAYKATPIAALEVETYTRPLDLELNAQMARFRQRHQATGMEQVTADACKRIKRQLNWRLQTIQTEGERRTRWTQQWANELTAAKAAKRDWISRWRSRKSSWGLADTSNPSRKHLARHKDLFKAESAILTQARTGRIGLAAFLYKRKVPGFNTATCCCGQSPETVKHVVVHCQRFDAAREELRESSVEQPDFLSLVIYLKRVRKLAKWLI